MIKWSSKKDFYIPGSHFLLKTEFGIWCLSEALEINWKYNKFPSNHKQRNLEIQFVECLRFIKPNKIYEFNPRGFLKIWISYYQKLYGKYALERKEIGVVYTYIKECFIHDQIILWNINEDVKLSWMSREHWAKLEKEK